MLSAGRTRSSVAVLGVLVVLVAAALVSCSDSDDAKPSGGAAGDTSGTAAPTDAAAAPAPDPYDGHTSDVYDGTKNWICHPDLPSTSADPSR